MELFLFLTALCAFSLQPAGAPVLLRCGLTACLRFSPRAALALSSLAALISYASLLLCRGGLRAVPIRQRAPAAMAAVFGGTLGRMLLLMFTARFPGSLALARLQVFPLLMFALAASFPRLISFSASHAGLFILSLLCAVCEGFFGCGGAVLFLLSEGSGVRRRRFSPSGAALLLCFVAQLSALLLTAVSGAAEIFPLRMLLSLLASAALGSLLFEKTKKRSPVKTGLRITLCMYTVLAALAGIEQSFLY